MTPTGTVTEPQLEEAQIEPQAEARTKPAARTKTETQRGPAKFGAVLGVSSGDVAVYSSDYETADDNELPDRHSYRSYVDDHYMGHKWQCVELARRWLYLNHGYLFDEVSMAYEIFRLRSVRRISDGARLPLHSFRNGSRRHPEPGCLLIWNEGGDFERTGHVAVVTEVFPDRVRVVEQNFNHLPWAEGQTYSREVEARVAYDGGYWLRCPQKQGTILGWVIQTEDSQHSEKEPELDPRLFDIQMREAVHEGQAEASWLNEANPDEQAYVAMMKGHTMADNEEDRYKYLCVSESAHRELRRATNDLHGLFLHATDWVLQKDSRLAPFGIPEALWPRIHQSWDNRRNEMITGRFDFSLTERGIKVYEYNSDSASCHLECGKVQCKWADHFIGDFGQCPGEHLFNDLVRAWRRTRIDGVLHVMHDDDPEEIYHALYMKEAIEAAGISTKTLLGFEGLSWQGETIVDPDGLPIRWVWKTWAWETALDQIRAECEEDDLRLREYKPDVHDAAPRLVDVLLRPNVRVYEPLWTLIPSNKSILPVLWKLFPEHPYLLEAHYELTDSLRRDGYVAKPIAGRCGSNISLYGADNQLVAETAGRFEHQDFVYQALFPLPKAGGSNIQLCTFSVGGLYSGTCARVDTSPVINWDSNLLPLRVLEDTDLLAGA